MKRSDTDMKYEVVLFIIYEMNRAWFHRDTDFAPLSWYLWLKASRVPTLLLLFRRVQLAARPRAKMAAAQNKMVGSGCCGLILHILYSIFFVVWLVLALIVQGLTVSWKVAVDAERIPGGY